MITFKTKGDWKKTTEFLNKVTFGLNLENILKRAGEEGVNALEDATPVKTGKAAHSWSYEIVNEPGFARIEWHNDDVENGYNVAILVQYGHAARDGSYVEGIDYINPAMKPIFDDISRRIWQEVENE